MKYAFAPVVFGLGANALIARQASQCIQLQASGGQSGVLGQLSDGQNRVGGGHPTGCYCLSNGGFTDSNGRGCILTPPTTQFQCDVGASPTTGFATGSDGQVTYNGSSKFYACPASDSEYNIYTSPVDGQDKCVEISLSSAGSCGSGATVSSAPAASQPARSSAVPQPSQPAQSFAVVPKPSQPVQSSAVVPKPSQPAQSSAVVPKPSAPAPKPSAPAQSYPAQSQPAPEPSQPAKSSNAPKPSQPAKSSADAPKPSAPAQSYPAQSQPAPEPSQPAKSSADAPKPSAPAQSTLVPKPSAPAQSAPAPGPSAPAQTGNKCPADLNGAYQYPHLIVPVDSQQSSKAFGTSYNGTVVSHVCSIFNFDIPTSYSGKTCSVVFLFPEQKDLETSSFTVSGSGSVAFTKLKGPASQKTTYANQPGKESDLTSMSIAPGNSYTITSGDCAAGETVAYELCGSGDFALNYFQDYNPSPIGLYVRQC